MNFDTIGYVRRDFPSLYDWCNHQSRMKSMSSSRVAFDRTHKWFGYEVILKPNAEIKKGHWDERVNRLGDRIFPGWNCALLCHYRPGGRMIRHCDHSVFEPLVVLVNIGRATLCIDNQEHHLEDGQVIKFDSSIPHELLPVVSERWSLSIAKICKCGCAETPSLPLVTSVDFTQPFAGHAFNSVNRLKALFIESKLSLSS